MKGPKKVLGRPVTLKINPIEVEKLASFGCSGRDIAEFFGCHESTISERFKSIIAQGRGRLKFRLRMMQIKCAEKGNVAMLIFLGKNLLDQADKPLESSIPEAAKELKIVRPNIQSSQSA